MKKWAARMGMVFAAGTLVVGVLVHHRASASSYVYISELRSPVCGILSVVNVCALAGANASFDDVVANVGTVSPRGISLLGCKRALESYGIQSRGVSCKSLADLPEAVACVCALRTRREPHAVVVLRRGKKVLLIDGRTIRHYDIAELDRVFLNMALITH